MSAFLYSILLMEANVIIKMIFPPNDLFAQYLRLTVQPELSNHIWSLPPLSALLPSSSRIVSTRCWENANSRLSYELWLWPGTEDWGSITSTGSSLLESYGSHAVFCLSIPCF
jgi:hypothetical protein